MKDNKKIITATIIGILILAIALTTYYILNAQDKNTTLTLLDKQWIESNKNKVIDFGIVNNIPVFNAEGEGVFFDFLTALESNTKLGFNKVSYDVSSAVKTDYTFKVVDKATGNDIIVYRDNYVVLTKLSVKYNQVSDIKNITIGVLRSDLDKVSRYLTGAVNVTYKPYETVTSLLASATDATVNAIILPKNTYLKEIVSSSTLNIAYNITEMTQDYVITLGKTSNLNTIITKYYKKWYKDNYETSYDMHLTSNYFKYSIVDEKEKVKFRSKRYSYGFIANLPYDSIDKGRLVGINNSLLKSFSKLANIEISFKEYGNISALLSDFNANKLDFFYSNNNNTSYKMDVFNTVSTFDNTAVIASPFGSNLLVNSFNSLIGKEVSVVKDSKIAGILLKNNIAIKTYNNVKELIINKKSDAIIAIDYYTYTYYYRNELANYNIDYEFAIENGSTFVARDIQANKVFNNFLNFYITTINERNVIDNTYNELYQVKNKSLFIQNLITYGSYLALALVIGVEIRKSLALIEKRKIPTLSKTDKLRYVDMLTCLKNRNYLNDNIEDWDDSEIYPQTIIIIDLNNVAYINDNYGHEEGDNVITEAANILITNQIENSEIIRTDGNEFLVYLVGHDEKEVVSYMRRLGKEFKGLDHGFGAAMGYSIINDAIKTIDDAVNEATLDMRNNKEELNN